MKSLSTCPQPTLCGPLSPGAQAGGLSSVHTGAVPPGFGRMSSHFCGLCSAAARSSFRWPQAHNQNVPRRRQLFPERKESVAGMTARARWSPTGHSPLPVPWMTHHHYLPCSEASTNERPWQQAALAFNLSAGLLGTEQCQLHFVLPDHMANIQLSCRWQSSGVTLFVVGTRHTSSNQYPVRVP